MGPFGKKSIRMKTSQSNIVYTLILSACFFVNKGYAQGITPADSTKRFTHCSIFHDSGIC